VSLQVTLTPVSRGASCDGLPGPCELTDGVPGGVELFVPRNRFTVRLARPALIRAVVFRDALVDTTIQPAEELSVKSG
jgi:hypothetical protein